MENKTKRAAEIYQVSSDYKRFDQKNNILMQTLWKKEMIEKERQKTNNFNTYFKNEKAGYSWFDNAFLQGSMAFIKELDFGINFADQKGNSWVGLDLEVVPEKEKLSNDKVTKASKKAAMMYGADAVGITEIDRKWFYSHWYDKESEKSYPICFSDENTDWSNFTEPKLLVNNVRVIPEKMNKAIVLLFEMNYDRLRYAPTALAYAETMKTYAKMGYVINSLANFVRALGYQAIPSMNCTALNVPLAIDAGLGQIGRHGKVVNEQLGSRVRIAKIITDMPLLEDQVKGFGVTEFCDTCKKCAKECPSNAISLASRKTQAIDETGNSNYLRWIIDHKACYEYMVECGTNCNICMYVCPYNRGFKWTKNVIQLSRNSGSGYDPEGFIEGLEDMYSIEGMSNRSFKYWDKN